MSPIKDQSSPLLWRSIEELSSSADFEEYFHREIAQRSFYLGRAR